MTIDKATLTLREEQHLNGGKEWFGYIHRCIQQPRLTRKTSYIRKDQSTQVEWRVDGTAVASFDAALLALETPPSLSDDERAILLSVGDEPADLRGLAFAEPEENRLRWHCLREKGLLSWERGRCVRTDAARELLAA